MASDQFLCFLENAIKLGLWLYNAHRGKHIKFYYRFKPDRVPALKRSFIGVESFYDINWKGLFLVVQVTNRS